MFAIVGINFDPFPSRDGVSIGRLKNAPSTLPAESQNGLSSRVPILYRLVEVAFRWIKMQHAVRSRSPYRVPTFDGTVSLMHRTTLGRSSAAACQQRTQECPSQLSRYHRVQSGRSAVSNTLQGSPPFQSLGPPSMQSFPTRVRKSSD